MKREPAKYLHINHWCIDMVTGELRSLSEISEPSEVADRIDPLGIKLIHLLAEHKDQVVAKETLIHALWPDTEVNEEALSRCVSRVRKQLGDNARAPQYIETLPKRGYRLVVQSLQWTDTLVASTTDVQNESPAQPSRLGWVLGITCLLLVVAAVALFSANTAVQHDAVDKYIQQADEYYHAVNRKDNEMALELYQQAIGLNPRSPHAHSGLANALVQRAIRMPGKGDYTWESTSLSDALADGRLERTEAKKQLERALSHANKAIELAPSDARSHKAHGFVLSAQNQLENALLSYQTALSYAPDAWDVLINMGDVYEISGQLTNAIDYYKKALSAMSDEQAARSEYGRPWRASLGATIGNKYLQQNNVTEAEIWFRHVLSFAPFNEKATVGLADVLIETGRPGEAARLCRAYTERVGIKACTLNL